MILKHSSSGTRFGFEKEFLCNARYTFDAREIFKIIKKQNAEQEKMSLFAGNKQNKKQPV